MNNVCIFVYNYAVMQVIPEFWSTTPAEYTSIHYTTIQVYSYTQCITSAYLCIIMQLCKLYLNSGPQHKLSIQVYIIQLYKYSYTQCITSAYLCIIMQLCKLYLNFGPQHQLSIQVYIIQLYKYSYTQCITSAYLCIIMQLCKLY